MRTSLNIPQEVIDSFDEAWKTEGLESRSRATREAIHEYIERHTELEDIEGDVVAAVAFDYEHTLVIGELHTVQHEFEDIIGTTHITDRLVDAATVLVPAVFDVSLLSPGVTSQSSRETMNQRVQGLSRPPPLDSHRTTQMGQNGSH